MAFLSTPALVLALIFVAGLLAVVDLGRSKFASLIAYAVLFLALALLLGAIR